MKLRSFPRFLQPGQNGNRRPRSIAYAKDQVTSDDVSTAKSRRIAVATPARS
jgi:hypothetical protein